MIHLSNIFPFFIRRMKLIYSLYFKFHLQIKIFSVIFFCSVFSFTGVKFLRIEPICTYKNSFALQFQFQKSNAMNFFLYIKLRLNMDD